MSRDDSRRKFLKKVIISGTGSVTFVKAAAGAAEPSLPSIISLLLDEDDAPITPIGEAVFDALSAEADQSVTIPDDANFMLVDAKGAGGGGSPSIAFLSESAMFASGASGGAGGRAQAVFDLRAGSQFANLGGASATVAQVGTGGRPGISDEGGQNGLFSGGRGGSTQLVNAVNRFDGGTAGSGGGGLAAITIDRNPIIVAGGGGGAGGGVGGIDGPSTVKVGGKGGDGGAFDDAVKRAGEDGAANSNTPALGGNRVYLDGQVVINAASTGGSPADGVRGFAGDSGEGPDGGIGGNTVSPDVSGGAGGGGGAGVNRDNGAGSGGGGGGGNNSGGGGGAAGSNFVDGETALPGFKVDAGVGSAGGQGGRAGEAAEISASDIAGEVGAPAQIIVTFFADQPEID